MPSGHGSSEALRLGLQYRGAGTTTQDEVAKSTMVDKLRMPIQAAGFLMALLAISAQPLRAENLCPNPSLESGYLVPLGWRSSTAEGMTWPDTVARSGQRSLQIAGNGEAGTWSFRLRVKPGRRYRFSCYLKAEAVPVDDGGHLEIAWTRKGAAIDNEWGYPRKRSASVNGPQWRQVSITSQSDGAHVDGVLISFVGAGAGSVWADDFAVEDIGPSVTHDGRWYELEDAFFDLDGAPASPHIKWSSPGAGKKPRVLFICPIGAGREILETSRRLEIEYELAHTTGHKEIAATNFVDFGDERFSEARVLQGLRDKLALDYDAVVIGKIKWKLLPQDVRDNILRKVRSGTGLFYSYDRGTNGDFEAEVLGEVEPVDNGLIRKIPWQSMPVFGAHASAADVAEKLYFCGTLGRGRIVVFRPTESRHQFLTPRASNEEIYIPLYYEYSQAYLAHLLSWLSATTPTALIESVDIDAAYAQATVEGKHATVQLDSKSQAAGKLFCTIRSEARQALAAESVDAIPLSIEPGKQSVRVPLPFLETGRHFLELKLEVAGQTHDWHVSAFDVTGTRTIREIRLARDEYVDGDSVEGTVVLDAPAEGFDVRMRVTDTHGRLVHEWLGPAGSRTEIPFRFTLVLPRANLFHVTAQLRRDDRSYCEAKAWFGCPTIDRRDFKMGVWSGAGNDHINQLALTAYRNVGVDMVLAQINVGHYPFNGYNIARNNLDVLVYGSASYRYMGTSNTKPDRWCLSTVSFKQREEQSLQRITEIYRPFGIHGFCVGNDGAHSWSKTDACFSQSCQARFRDYLEAEYGSLDKLNEAWKSGFDSWTEVRPVALEDARTTGNYVPWIDHRMHSDDMFATSVTEWSPRWVEAIAPGVPVGIDVVNPGSAWWHANSAYRLAENNAVWIPYRNLHHARIMTSFARTWGSRGVYAGGYNWETTEYWQGLLPWWILYNGFDSFIWFMGYYGTGTTNSTPLLTPKLTASEDYLACYKGVEEIKGGIGKLLINTPRRPAKIALVVSQPGAYVNAIHPAWAGHEYWGWLRTMLEAGYGVDFIDARELATYSPKLQSYRVVCLPYFQSMSSVEISNLKQFVQAGGCVIADVLPGVFDAHAIPYDAWPLADLFGLELKKQREPDFARITAGAYLGDTLFEAALSQTGVDKGVVPTQGKSLAHSTSGSPAVIHNQFGEGHAFYLNFFLPTCPTTEYEKIVFQILSHCGVDREMRLIDQERNAERAYGQITVWQSGNLALYGITPHKMLARDMDEYLGARYGVDENRGGQTATFRNRAHVYSLRDQKYHGDTDQIEINLKHGRAELYAALPYEIEGIELRLHDARQGFRPGDIVRFTVSLQAGSEELSTHCYHIELVDADNRLCPWFTFNTMAEHGKHVGELPLALNAKPGNWRLIAREVISGITAERGFEVRSAAPQ